MLELLFLSLVPFVSAKDSWQSFFVLDETQPGFRMTNVVLQDRNMSNCTREQECQFVLKKSKNGKGSSSKWFKATVASPEFIRTLLFEDCLSLKMRGEKQSKVFVMIINGQIKDIPCDMTTDGGGWTVFQRRVNGDVKFDRNWMEYKEGFGKLDSNFWLGLDLIHYMVSRGKSELRIDLMDFERSKAYARYGSVLIGDESHGYKLTVSKYSGTAGDALAYHNNMKFTTKDRDNDRYRTNCAKKYNGGFWFLFCLQANPNGIYPVDNENSGNFITWHPFKKRAGGIRFIEMKFRRIKASI